MAIKNNGKLFEYDSNILPYSQNFRFVSYRINLHISSCFMKKKKKKKKKKENGKITHIGKFCGLYMLSYT